MLKTPLPEKLNPLPFEVARNYSRDTLEQFYKRDKVLNQLITYLAELTEVVEGKKKFDVEKWYRGEPQNTPTLKEQLLGEIRKIKRGGISSDGSGVAKDLYDYPYNQALSDAEAIVNRLIP
jgi:hypothetical protein